MSNKTIVMVRRVVLIERVSIEMIDTEVVSGKCAIIHLNRVAVIYDGKFNCHR